MREQIARLFAGILCDDEECWMSYTSEADLILPLMEKVAQAARNKAVRTLEECGHDLAAKEVRAINITAIVEGVK